MIPIPFMGPGGVTQPTPPTKADFDAYEERQRDTTRESRHTRRKRTDDEPGERDE